MVLGYSPSLRHTSDGGRTWHYVNLGIATHLAAMALANDHDGWVAGADGLIIAATDRGQTWVRQPSGTTAVLRQIAVPGS